jgi:Flp pilus assembly pilin Flp
MKTFRFAHTVRRDDGQAMVEYGLLLGLVTVVSLGALSAMGSDVTGMYNAIEALLAAVPGA